MKIKIFVFGILFLVCGLFLSSGWGEEVSSKNLVIHSKNQKKSVVLSEVEIADTDPERMQGLMFRKSLPADHGMLFVFEEDTQNPFWMKNTPVALDIIFIDVRHQIVSLQENTTPFSEKLLHPTGSYRFVLEVNAGFAKKHQIQQGDQVSWN